MTKDCIFCKIVKGKIPAEIVAEMTNVVAFENIDPSADTHILIIPKKHIASFTDIKKERSRIFSQMLRLAQLIIRDNNIEKKYKLVINGGEYQFVPHLHLHVLGGEMKKKV